MTRGALQTALNAMANGSREPVREDDVVSIITTGDGPGHLVRALFGNCSHETLDRVAALLGLTPSQFVGAYRIARQKHAAGNPEFDALVEIVGIDAAHSLRHRGRAPSSAKGPPMPQINLPMDGACRCGKVRLRISAPPLLTMACHCTGCQRMTGSAFSLSAAIPSQGFVVTEGETVIGGLHGPRLHHHFCPHCMSWLFTRAEGMDWFVNVRATMLDDTSWFKPFVETCTSEKLPWAATGAVHSFAQFPPFDAFEGLTRDYMAS